jgi:hypothetical protein
VAETSYKAQAPDTLLFSSSSEVNGAVTFPGLIMTNLQPGEQITMVTEIPFRLIIQIWHDFTLPLSHSLTGTFTYAQYIILSAD